ncbi:uncharacterized protein J2T56_000322 [Natronobacillus azotifigens]|uniref:HD domain-containing protein n=1 Tax=Natronobacillus azotifigens TaxID=472978 RepID=A0A9J6R8L3_9BACI|nr:HD domain-containing protein [Natronobacillus azotifigens]MCZ0701903.1 HD domain-containing protein [Natronobacillus azotifigens]
MKEKEVIHEIEKYITKKFAFDTTGHNAEHMYRVAKMVKFLAIHEESDHFVCEISGWVHDLIDEKLTDNPEREKQQMLQLLQKLQLSQQQIVAIFEAIITVSFRKQKTPTTKVGQIVQDADRLDALGAIGIARAFSYGGSKHRPIYKGEERTDDQSTVQHFYDKLLQLKEQMHTTTAKKIANDRHEFLHTFLEQFKREWYFLDEGNFV